MPETYLNSPRTTPVIPPAKPIHWTPIVIAAIAAGTVISVTDIVRKPASRPVPVPLAVVEPTPRPITPTPVPVVQPAVQVQRAELVPIDVRRALPVEGAQYRITMPAGEIVTTTYRGEVPSFDQLPRQPNLNDCYLVTASKHSWVFMQPAGFSAPAWVDP